MWGARGSVPTPGPATRRYGGNTSCLEVRLSDGTLLVLDAGTGIRELGLRLANDPPVRVHVLLTHLHLDHLAGLPFFAPLWDPCAEIHIWAPPWRWGLEDAIARYMSPPFFPIPISEVPAQVAFHRFPEGALTLGSGRVLAEPVRHRGPTVGYRIEEAGGRSLVYIPDHEPYSSAEPEDVAPARLSGYRLARGASLLIHDAQYSEEEYAARSGWGHSSVAHAVAFAGTVRAGRLVLFHHDPLHSDQDLAALEARAGELWNGVGQPPQLAREGMRLGFDEDVVEFAANG